jgi:hypothetical protein
VVDQPFNGKLKIADSACVDQHPTVTPIGFGARRGINQLQS